MCQICFLHPRVLRVLVIRVCELSIHDKIIEVKYWIDSSEKIVQADGGNTTRILHWKSNDLQVDNALR
jgi:hypothetical protein